MLNRHRIAVVSVIVCAVSTSFAAGQALKPDQGERIRQYLKIDKEQPALVVFMDFQCPACQKKWPAIKAALDHRPTMKFYSVSFPLVNVHKNAFGAAVAYEIARGSGVEKPAYDDLLSGKQNLETPSLNAYLRAHRLPSVVGTSKATKYEAKVNDQLKFATSLGINATPTLVLIDASGKATVLDSIDKLDDYLPR